MKNMNEEEKLKVALALAALGLGIYTFLMLRKRLRDKKAFEFYKELDALNPVTNLDMSDAFNIDYYKSIKNADLLTDSQAQNYAEQLDAAFGWYIGDLGINDNEEKIKSIFKQIANKAQISQVSEKYYEFKEMYLDERMLKQLDSDELETIMKIINAKPLK